MTDKFEERMEKHRRMTKPNKLMKLMSKLISKSSWWCHPLNSMRRGPYGKNPNPGKPGEIIMGLPEEERELLKDLTADQLNARLGAKARWVIPPEMSPEIEEVHKRVNKPKYKKYIVKR